MFMRMLLVVAELGDFNPDEHTEGYLSGLHFIPNQSEDFEEEVAKQHKNNRYPRLVMKRRICKEIFYKPVFKTLAYYWSTLGGQADCFQENRVCIITRIVSCSWT
ncbi:hypothetical protein DPMN_062174 [Dreissena polymorpha]|uniref:FERM central domain-containing protein n=1 Tax=Dreissena polymorpha TaxID=45954 RepID=A0A9D4HHW0_DREPO|nr:hypothetical protein DPMN_062174 [Dreissena polymorpha]